jgi:hypothetical protein
MANLGKMLIGLVGLSRDRVIVVPPDARNRYEDSSVQRLLSGLSSWN